MWLGQVRGQRAAKGHGQGQGRGRGRCTGRPEGRDHPKGGQGAEVWVVLVQEPMVGGHQEVTTQYSWTSTWGGNNGWENKSPVSKLAKEPQQETDRWLSNQNFSIC